MWHTLLTYTTVLKLFNPLPVFRHNLERGHISTVRWVLDCNMGCTQLSKCATVVTLLWILEHSSGLGCVISIFAGQTTTFNTRR